MGNSSSPSNDSGALDARPETAMDAVKGLDLTGKVFVVTGSYSGLGKASTKAFLSAKATVIVAGRNNKTQQAFVEELTAKDGYEASLIDGSHTLDLGDLSSVKEFAEYLKKTYKTIDCLVLNAGVMNTPGSITKDGFEVQMQTNAIGHFLLAKILADKTKRQVWLTSKGHSLVGQYPMGGFSMTEAKRIDLDVIKSVDLESYDGWFRYQQSKLADILLAKHFLVEYPRLVSVAVHPGVVQTNLGRHMSFMSMLKFIFAFLTGHVTEKIQTSEQGASTQVMCATMDEKQLVKGAYYVDCAVADDQCADSAKNMEDAKKLYDYCNDATKEFQK